MEKNNKEYLQERIVKTLKEINKTNNNIDNIFGYHNNMSFNLDLKNEYLFITPSIENLEKINITNIEKYKNIKIIDLQDLDYDCNILKYINDYLKTIKNTNEREDD